MGWWTASTSCRSHYRRLHDEPSDGSLVRDPLEPLDVKHPHQVLSGRDYLLIAQLTQRPGHHLANRSDRVRELLLRRADRQPAGLQLTVARAVEQVERQPFSDIAERAHGDDPHRMCKEAVVVREQGETHFNIDLREAA